MSRRAVVAFALLLGACAAVPAALAGPGPNGRCTDHTSNGNCDGHKNAYLVGAAVESINPTPAMIAAGDFFLGGYGITSGRVANRPEAQVMDGRSAVGILGDGVATRALVVSDGTTAVTLAQIDTQGYFAAYKQGPFGITDIRNHAAAEIARLRSSQGAAAGPAMGAGQILVDSNHTHGGPDTAGVWGGVPTAYLKLVHDQTVKAVVEAWQRLRPASLVYGAVKAGVEGVDPASTDPLTTNQFRGDPNNAATDDEVRVLQARDLATGSVLVTYVNLSAHATVLGSSNRYVTSDYTGALSNLLAATYGGIGFHQVGTLGRSQPARTGCSDGSLTGTARDLCALDGYAARVARKVATALSSAAPVSSGKPVVAMHSYFIDDAVTNAPIFALTYAGTAVGAPIYRSLTAPWMLGNAIGSMTFSGRIGDVLISGNPGEGYPQIPLAVRAAVSAHPGNTIRGFLSVSTAGDFLGYLIAPIEAYPEPLRRSVTDLTLPPNDTSCLDHGCLDPVGNDNYFFNPSHTFGERVTCSLLRGAGEVLGQGADTYWSQYQRCLAFATDHGLAADLDTTFPEGPDLSGTPVEAAFGGR
jgi:hypothetical protein